MANDYTALGSAIYSLLSGAATVSIYNQRAPQGGTPPYGIFNRQSAIDERTFNTAGISSDYVLKAVSNRVWPGEAKEVYQGLHSIMQDGALSVSGFVLLRNQRGSTFEYQDADGFWHVGGLYRIEIEES